MHPGSKSLHQLDLIISRREHLNNIPITRAFHDADFDTDHSLIYTKVQMRPKKFLSWDDFSLSISLKKTKVTCQGSEAMPALTIKDYTLDVVSQFTYLGSITYDNDSLDVELGKRIGKAASIMAKLPLECGRTRNSLPRLKFLSIVPAS